MAQSLCQVYLHIVFSTKHRTPWIAEKIQPELYAYMATILKTCNSPAILINGLEDHVHLLSFLSKNIAISKLLEEVKKRSSKWIKTKGKKLENFQWQNGYGAFSVSPSHVEAVTQYIRNQKEHHRKTTFQDEYRVLLKKHDLPCDERYVWD